MTRHFLVVAGGSSTRIPGSVPKQFALIAGKPLLVHTLEAICQASPGADIVLVLPEEYLSFWESLCVDHHFHYPHRKVAGGDSRYHSVQRGLALLPRENGFTAVHDGVRPFLTTGLCDRLFREAAVYGSAVPVIPVKDSLRRVSGENNTPVEREGIVHVQTPQVFRNEILHMAYTQPFQEWITDDASLVESAGFEIHLSEGDSLNFKITFPPDFVLAEALIGKRP